MKAGDPDLPEHSLSANILGVFDKLGEEATIGDLVQSVQHRGFGFLFVILNIVPMMPASSGIATPFGLMSMLLAAQIWMGRDEPWFPAKILARKVGNGLRKFLRKTASTLQKLERRLKPRLGGLYREKVFRYLMAPLIFLCAVSVAIPLPGTNSVAGLAILLIGLGMLEEDGLFGIAGIAIAILGLTGAVVSIYFLVVYGPQGAQMLKDFVLGR
ncbi:MAG: exopolysaccharide biosynthesis protein [Fimbriimonadaceae bacterium]